MIRSIIVILCLVAVIAVPFVLRPASDSNPSQAHDADILTIITPHNETIRYEFGEAFRRHMRETEDREIVVDWRTLGGTSEIERFLDTSFAYAFKRRWTSQPGRNWDEYEIGANFNNRRLQLPEDPRNDTPGQDARRAFINSDVGIGIDLFFGGGPYPFVIHAEKGHLVDSGVIDKHPEWFRDDVIPAEMSGEVFYDPMKRWIGCCLSSFGICYNRDSLARLDVPAVEPAWSDLGDPRLLGQVALADPTKSGSVTKAFEMLLQQQMRECLDAATRSGEPMSDEKRFRALAEGWAEGLKLIQRISGNARYFSNIAPKIPFDVAQGNAAMGVCIDFFGRTYNEVLLRPDGTSRAGYITPLGGSSTGVDPIAMLRGAPNPDLGQKFIEFVLSVKGQKIWDYRAGIPGGPVKVSLRRLPLRKDLYTPEHLPFLADASVMPYENADRFRYEPEWTARAFGAIRFIIRAACLDSHDELRDAWKALIDHGFPPEATQSFHNLAPVSYDKALGEINATLRSSNAIDEMRLAKALTQHFRESYRRAARLAKQKK